MRGSGVGSTLSEVNVHYLIHLIKSYEVLDWPVAANLIATELVLAQTDLAEKDVEIKGLLDLVTEQRKLLAQASFDHGDLPALRGMARRAIAIMEGRSERFSTLIHRMEARYIVEGT